MNRTNTLSEADIMFQTLSYATRLLASEKDLGQLVENAVDILSDFGHSNKVEFYTIDEENPDKAMLRGLLDKGIITRPNKTISLKEARLEDIIDIKRPEIIKRENGNMIYLPLIGAGNDTLGLLVLHVDEHQKPEYIELRSLIILTTIIAVSLEYALSARLAMYDSLTGLFIRRQMDLHLEHEINRIKRYSGEFSVAMLDIDHFKRLNDTYGHLFGDQVLQELAHLIRDTIRQKVDIPCRYGGEEFIIILPNTNAMKAYEMTERLRSLCENHEFLFKGKPIPVTFSAGVVVIKDANTSPKEIIARVDKLLYSAKESGRNQVRHEK